MVMDQRKKSTGILPSQNALSAESKIHGRRRLSNKTEVFQRRTFRIEVLFFSFAIVFIVFYGSLSNTLISLPENQDYQSYDRVLYQVIPDAEINLDAKVPDALLPQRPRTFGYYFGDSFIGAETLDPNTIRLYDSRGMPDTSDRDLRKQQELLDSREYRKGRATPIEKGDCVAQHEWQKSFYPTCNYVMEQDLTNLWQNSTAQDTYARYLANGYWRDVWTVKEASDETTVLKTMRYEHDYTPRNYDRHRRDAVAMERLTSSRYILDIYAFCGNSGLFEFASGGSLTDNAYYSIDAAWTPKETLIVAHQVASGIDAVHHFEKDGVPAIAHTDISPDQYVYVAKDNIFKLNDFNRCRFLAWNKKKDEACTFEVGSNPGTFRSPEEYDYDPESEKVDIYSIGNIFFGLLTRMFPFEIEKLESKEVKRTVRKGGRPKINETYMNSTDPYTQVLLKCISMCWVQDPEDRISAAKLLEFIAMELKRLG